MGAEKKDDHKKLYERFVKCSEFGILEIFTKNVENNDYYKKFYEQVGRYSKLGIPEIFTKIAEKKVGKCLKFGFLGMFAEIAEKKGDYEKFYEKVGKCLKFGILETFAEIAENKVGKCLKFGILEMFAEIAEMKDDHKKFYEQFGKRLKLGILGMFAEVDGKKDDYKKFYEQLRKYLKLGIHEDSMNRTKVAVLMRYRSSESGDEQVSFKEYVDRMEEGENDAYYITDESIVVVSSSPYLETLRMKGLEVLYMADPVDEYAVKRMKKFYKQLVDTNLGWCNVYPNAGLPNAVGGYDENSEIFATNWYDYAKDDLLYPSRVSIKALVDKVRGCALHKLPELGRCLKQSEN